MDDKHDSKIERNSKALRHYWNKALDECECGCKTRIFVNSNWICLWNLNEKLKDDGYKIVRDLKEKKILRGRDK